VFYDASEAKLSDESFFVNQTLTGWTRAALRIVYRFGPPESPMGETLAVESPGRPHRGAEPAGRGCARLVLAMLLLGVLLAHPSGRARA
jgi:hypothetical protein